jgi:hypothetical protein
MDVVQLVVAALLLVLPVAVLGLLAELHPAATSALNTVAAIRMRLFTTSTVRPRPPDKLPLIKSSLSL